MRSIFRVMRVLFCAIFFFGCISLLSASEDAPVELPPFRVEGKFSELLCGARFRYHIPGAKLKELTVRKSPKSWRDAGVKAGDAIVKIADVAIDGTSLPTLAKRLDALFKSEHPKCVFEIRSADSKKILRLETEFEKDQSDFTIAYP